VLATVGQCLTSDSSLCLKSVNCFKSWAQFGMQLPDIEHTSNLIYQVAGILIILFFFFFLLIFLQREVSLLTSSWLTLH